MYADPWACMQVHELTWSYIKSLQKLTYSYICMELQKLAYRSMSLNEVPWACMQFHELVCSPFFVWAAQKKCLFFLKILSWNTELHYPVVTMLHHLSPDSGLCSCSCSLHLWRVIYLENIIINTHGAILNRGPYQLWNPKEYCTLTSTCHCQIKTRYHRIISFLIILPRNVD